MHNKIIEECVDTTDAQKYDRMELKALSYCALAGFKTNATNTSSNKSLNEVDGRVSCCFMSVFMYIM